MSSGRTQLVLILFLFLIVGGANAQTKYWVFFTNKGSAQFDPAAFFHHNALERRLKAGLPASDYSDFPVTLSYISEVSKYSDSMGNPTRWFNGVGAWIKPGNLHLVQNLPFVREVIPMSRVFREVKENEDIPEDSELVRLQISRLQGDNFLENGYRGKGIRIAVLDVGFKGTKSHSAFKHLYTKGQVIETFDFLKHDSDVYRYGSHGTMVLSCIAGLYQDSIPMGMAQDAEFLLARTERNFSEFHDEEDNWLAAVEWADQKGAHIVSSSLGYTSRRYFEYDMNGHTSLVSRAANMAARKGMLVIIAAGNEAKNKWKHICTPADADSALTVGGTNPKTNYHADFSSLGPSADGDLKPNIVAPGYAWVADANSFSAGMGTSFATPLVAGFAACAWNIFPDWDNFRLFNELQQSAQLYPYFDYAHGYGTPQADYFTEKKFNEESGKSPPMPKTATFHFDTTAYDFAIILHDSVSAETVSYESPDNKLVYYHVADTTGRVVRYYVLQPGIDPYAVEGYKYTPITLNWDDIPEYGIVRVHFKGYTHEYNY